jgi:hypothetical protein
VHDSKKAPCSSKCILTYSVESKEVTFKLGSKSHTCVFAENRNTQVVNIRNCTEIMHDEVREVAISNPSITAIKIAREVIFGA